MGALGPYPVWGRPCGVPTACKALGALVEQGAVLKNRGRKDDGTFFETTYTAAKPWSPLASTVNLPGYVKPGDGEPGNVGSDNLRSEPLTNSLSGDDLNEVSQPSRTQETNRIFKPGAGDQLIPFDEVTDGDRGTDSGPSKAGEVLIPFQHMTVDAILEAGRAAALRQMLGDAFDRIERLPFTYDLLRKIQRLSVDPKADPQAQTARSLRLPDAHGPGRRGQARRRASRGGRSAEQQQPIGAGHRHGRRARHAAGQAEALREVDAIRPDRKPQSECAAATTARTSIC